MQEVGYIDQKMFDDELNYALIVPINELHQYFTFVDKCLSKIEKGGGEKIK